MRATKMGDVFGMKLSKSRRVMTRYGEREVQFSNGVTEQFWAAWRDRKDDLKKEGYSVSKDGGKWKVSIWRELKAATVKTTMGRTQDTSHETPWLDPVFLAQEGPPPWAIDDDKESFTAYDLAYQRCSRGR